MFYFQTIINHCFKLHAFVIAVLIKYRLWNHLQFRYETQNLAVTLGETCVCIHKLVACTLNEAYSPLSLQLTRSLYSLDCILLYFIVLRVRTLTRVTKTWWDERTDGGGGGGFLHNLPRLDKMQRQKVIENIRDGDKMEKEWAKSEAQHIGKMLKPSLVFLPFMSVCIHPENISFWKP